MLKPLEFCGTFRDFKLDWTGRGTWSPIVWIQWFSSGWRYLHILELVRPVGLVGHPPRSVSLQQQFLHHSRDFTTTIHSHQFLHKTQNASPCTLGSGCCYQLLPISRSIWEERDSALKQTLLWVKPGGVGEGGDSCCLHRWNGETLSSIWFLAAGLVCSMPNKWSLPCVTTIARWWN